MGMKAKETVSHPLFTCLSQFFLPSPHLLLIPISPFMERLISSRHDTVHPLFS